MTSTGDNVEIAALSKNPKKPVPGDLPPPQFPPVLQKPLPAIQGIVLALPVAAIIRRAIRHRFVIAWRHLRDIYILSGSEKYFRAV